MVSKLCSFLKGLIEFDTLGILQLLTQLEMSYKISILDFFIQKIFFLLNPMKNSQRFLDSKDGSKF